MLNKTSGSKLQHSIVSILCLIFAGAFLGGCFSTPAVTTSTTSATALETTATATVTSSTTAGTKESTTTGSESAQTDRPLETSLILQIEGAEEKVAALLYQSDLGYDIYIENDKYIISMIESQIDKNIKADKFTSVETLDGYPDLYLEIGHLDYITRDAALMLMQNQLVNKFPSLTQEGDIGVGVNKLDALVLHGSNGTDWDSEAMTSAVFSDGRGGAYYYIIVYYIQVAEGYASRFNQYLDTFRIK